MLRLTQPDMDSDHFLNEGCKLVILEAHTLHTKIISTQHEFHTFQPARAVSRCRWLEIMFFSHVYPSAKLSGSDITLAHF